MAALIDKIFINFKRHLQLSFNSPSFRSYFRSFAIKFCKSIAIVIKTNNLRHSNNWRFRSIYDFLPWELKWLLFVSVLLFLNFIINKLQVMLIVLWLLKEKKERRKKERKRKKNCSKQKLKSLVSTTRD